MHEYPNSRSRGLPPSVHHSRLVAPIVDAADRSAERVEALIDALVASLDLPDVVDEAGSFGAESGEEQRHSGSDVGRFEERSAETGWAVNEGTMRVAEHDSGAHRRQLVDEEHARLKHLFVHEDQTLALCRSDDRDRHRIGRESRPG